MQLSPNDYEFDALVDGIRLQSNRILDYLGITIQLEALPSYREYAKVRYQLQQMGRIRRWLSRRLRDKKTTLWIQVSCEMLDAVLREKEADNDKL